MFPLPRLVSLCRLAGSILEDKIQADKASKMVSHFLGSAFGAWANNRDVSIVVFIVFLNNCKLSLVDFMKLLLGKMSRHEGTAELNGFWEATTAAVYLSVGCERVTTQVFCQIDSIVSLPRAWRSFSESDLRRRGLSLIWEAQTRGGILTGHCSQEWLS